MTVSSPMIRVSSASLVAEWVEEFFRRSQGSWRSQRRYYTLQNDDVQEVTSFLTVQFLPHGDEQLIHLAGLHGFADQRAIRFGALTTWESNYEGPVPRQVKGSTVFGVLGSQLYRDRGFATPKPVVADFTMRDAQTMLLRTEYDGSLFEEELKLVGSQYRARQTIISRGAEQLMIGQYLENRI